MDVKQRILRDAYTVIAFPEFLTERVSALFFQPPPLLPGALELEMEFLHPRQPTLPKSEGRSGLI